MAKKLKFNIVATVFIEDAGLLSRKELDIFKVCDEKSVDVTGFDEAKLELLFEKEKSRILNLLINGN